MEHEKVIGLKIAGENHTALNGFIAKQQIEIEICMCKGKINSINILSSYKNAYIQLVAAGEYLP